MSLFATGIQHALETEQKRQALLVNASVIVQERQAWLVSVAETEQERLAEVRGKMYSCVADSLNVGQFICA